MRQDMYKLITECYRVGDKSKYRKRRCKMKQALTVATQNEDWDEIDSHESMRGWAIKNHGGKEFGENLNPLKRFIRSSAGRPWPEVHSEMSANINCNSEAQRHVWLHAIDYVEEKTFIGDDGQVYYYPKYVSSSPRPISESYAEVYVHPETGLIQLIPNKKSWRYRHKPHKLPRIEIDKWRQGHKIGDHWFVIELAEIPGPQWKPWSDKDRQKLQKKIDDAEALHRNIYGDALAFKSGVTGRWIVPEYNDVAIHAIAKYNRVSVAGWSRSYYNSYGVEWFYGRPGVYAKTCKQMNTNELKRYGLKKVPGKPTPA